MRNHLLMSKRGAFQGPRSSYRPNTVWPIWISSWKETYHYLRYCRAQYHKNILHLPVADFSVLSIWKNPKIGRSNDHWHSKTCENDHWIGGQFHVFWNARHWKIRHWTEDYVLFSPFMSQQRNHWNPDRKGLLYSVWKLHSFLPWFVRKRVEEFPIGW